MAATFDQLRERIKNIDAGEPSALPNEALLKQLGLLTRDGKLNQDARRKLKQILHLSRQILPFLEKIYTDKSEPQIVDAGAGKAYFGFVLCDLLCRPFAKGRVTSIEHRPELVQQCQRLAEAMQLGTRMRFELSPISEAPHFESPPDLVCALHACDTATDDAILLGLRAQATHFALVPCCQAEIAQSLKDLPRDALWPLWRHAIQGREFGSHLTNVIRGLVLESRGYKVHVTEFTGWEHSLKNELIMAEKVQHSNPLAQKQLEGLLAKFPVQMKLLKLLPAPN